MVITSDADVLWRFVNACIALLSLIVMLYQTIRYYKRMTPRSRLLSQALSGMLVAVCIGAWENVRQENPTGFRTAIVSASVAWTLLAVLTTTPKGSHEIK